VNPDVHVGESASVGSSSNATQNISGLTDVCPGDTNWYEAVRQVLPKIAHLVEISVEPATASRGTLLLPPEETSLFPEERGEGRNRWYFSMFRTFSSLISRGAQANSPCPPHVDS